jgi:hypothetical protein
MPIGEQFAAVVEDDHSVAEQSPPLFGVKRDETGRVMI